GGQADATGAVELLQLGEKDFPILAELATQGLMQGGEKIADFLLACFPCFVLLETGVLVLLVAVDQALESTLFIQQGDAVGVGEEIEPQRALHGDLVKAEVLVIENLGNNQPTARQSVLPFEFPDL